MISDERLEEVINGDILFTDEQREMAKELLAYRKAFSEPVASVYFDSYYGCQASFAKQINFKGGESLYRKPIIPGQEI